MDVQSGRATTAPDGEEDVCWARYRVRHHTRGLLGGGQGSGLDSSENHVSNGVMARDAVTIATTTNLMVTEDVSSATAFRAGDLVAEDILNTHNNIMQIRIKERKTSDKGISYYTV